MASIKHERRRLKSGKISERWIVSYYAGPPGARTRQYEACSSERAANKLKIDIEDQEQRGEVLSHKESPTVCQACETYLKACETGTRQSKRAKKALRAQTVEAMRARLKLWLYTHDIGDRLLSQISRRDIAGYADWLMSESEAGKREMEQVFQHLKATLGEARIRGELHQDFWSDIVVRRAESDAVDEDGEDEDSPWSDIPSHAEAWLLIETARLLRDDPNRVIGWEPDDAPWRKWRANSGVAGGRGHNMISKAWRRYYPLVATSFWSGMRMSEERALQRRDIDLMARTIKIRRSADLKGRINRPKSKAGHRILPIPEPLVPILRDWLEEIPADPTAFVFATNGRPLKVEQIYRDCWKRLLHYAGIDRQLKWHGMRAYYATCHASRGTEPNTLMKLMGHEDPRTTFAIYARIHKEDVDVMISAADTVAKMARPEVSAEAAE